MIVESMATTTTNHSTSSSSTTAEGHLRIRRGLGNTAIGTASMTALYSLHCTGPRPKAEVHGGEVELTYPLLSLRRRRQRDAITLNSAVPWSIHVDGGVGGVTADFSRVALRRLRFDGGVARTEVSLPAPEGTLRVTLGAASRVTLSRPGGVPVRVTIRRGSSALTVDDQCFGAIGGAMTVASPDFATARDRIDIVIDSADRLTVTSLRSPATQAGAPARSAGAPLA
jgi:hypothetical protein